MWLWLILGTLTFYLLTRTLPPYTGALPTTTGLHDTTFVVAGVPRTVWCYNPQSIRPSAPVLLLFHETDGGGHGAIQDTNAQAFAEAAQCTILAPEARTLLLGDWDNHEPGQRFWVTYPNLNPNVNPDLQLVQVLIAEAVARGADPKQVYVAGLSSGGYFATCVAFTLADKIAGFAAFASGLEGADKPAPLPAGRIPPAYVFHAEDDDTVPVERSRNLLTRLTARGAVNQAAIVSSGGHDWPVNALSNAWAFLKQHVL